jgi:adenosylhomocysteine nucleosidase
MKDIILIALKEEAPTLSKYNNVFFTGIGKVNAASKTAMLIERYKPNRIINFGTAGGINVSSGFHQVGKFVQRDMLCSELGSALGQTPFEDGVVLDLGEGFTCSTGDNFVTDPNLQIPADIVDMESFAIAKVCKMNNVEFLCYKFVSDSADNDASSDWASQVSKGEIYYITKCEELNISLS